MKTCNNERSHLLETVCMSQHSTLSIAPIKITSIRHLLISIMVTFLYFRSARSVITETFYEHITETPLTLTFKAQVISARCQSFCNEQNVVQTMTSYSENNYRPYVCKTDHRICQECTTKCNTKYNKLEDCTRYCESSECVAVCQFLEIVTQEETKSEEYELVKRHRKYVKVITPEVACVYTPGKDDPEEGSTVVLKWDAMDFNGQPSKHILTFIVEIYEERTPSGVVMDWTPIGHTNYTALPVVKLNPLSMYKFRVSAVASEGLVSHPVTSELIDLTKAKQVEIPTNISLRQYVSNYVLRAEVTWQIKNNIGCYFKLYWMTTSEKSYHYRELREPMEYKYELSDLTFDSNYSLEIQTYDRRFHRASSKVIHLFHTQSCLESTNFNYTSCVPDAPKKLEFKVHEPQIFDDIKLANVTLSWLPPPRLSYANMFIQYIVMWRKNPDIRYITQIQADRRVITVPPNITEVMLIDFHWNSEYVVTVSAESQAGIGEKAAVTVITGDGYSRLISDEDENKVVATQMQRPRENLYFATIIPAILTAGAISVCVIYFVKAKKEAQHGRSLSRREEAINPLYEFSASKQQPVETEPLIITDEYEVDYSCLKLTITLGEGAFGKVMKADFTPPGSYHGRIGSLTRTVAVKTLKEHATPEERRFLLLEIGTMKILGSHPNLVSIVACITNTTRPCLIMDYCPLGDLRNYLRQHRSKVTYMTSSSSGVFSGPTSEALLYSNGSTTDKNMITLNSIEKDGLHYRPEQEILSQTTLLSYARQIALGMEYLNQNRFIHRDLAARNILMASQKCIKISDFGLSRDVYETNVYQPTSARKLPFKWMPIESIFDQVFTIKSDVWSYGILLWEIVTLGGCPYPGVPNCDLFSLLSEGYRLERPNNCSPDIYKIMLSCWHPCIEDRPSFSLLRKKIEALLEASCSYIDLSKEVSADYYRSDSSDEVEFPTRTNSSKRQQEVESKLFRQVAVSAENVMGNPSFRRSKRYSRFETSSVYEDNIAQICSYYPVSKGPYVLETNGPVPGLSEELLHKALSSVDLAKCKQNTRLNSSPEEDSQSSVARDDSQIQTISQLVDTFDGRSKDKQSNIIVKTNTPGKPDHLSKSKLFSSVGKRDAFGMDFVYPNISHKNSHIENAEIPAHL